MNAILETKFKDHWSKTSNELAEMKSQISKKILADEIASEADITKLVEEKCQTIIHGQTTCIQSINEIEFHADFKDNLISKLQEQAQQVSRDLQISLRDEYLKYKSDIKDENEALFQKTEHGTFEVILKAQCRDSRDASK